MLSCTVAVTCTQHNIMVKANNTSKPTSQVNKISELMLTRRATSSVESAATSGISVQRAIMRFERSTQIWRRRTEDYVEIWGSKLGQLKSTFNAVNFIRRLSWPISSDFGAI